MNKTSRIRISKELLYCARMFLDAAHIKEAKEIEAKNIMAMPSHHTKLKRYIIKNFSITRPSRFGEDISDALLNKLDLHHKDGIESGHEIDNSNDSSKDTKILHLLDGTDNSDPEYKKQLIDEINTCVALPREFHHNIKSLSIQPGDSADMCYEKLDMELAKENWESIESLDILKKIDKITTLVSSQTGKLKNEQEINETIKKLYFLIHKNIELSPQDIIQKQKK